MNDQLFLSWGVTLLVSFAGRQSFPFSFYVMTKGENLMGVDLFDRLGFQIVDTMTNEKKLLMVDGKVRQKWSNIFQGLGKVEKFSHQPMLRQDVTPVRQTMRRIPLSLRKEVSEEISRMLSEGIIEQIDTSPRMSNVVIVRKKSGDIRLCLDLRQVNKAVIPDAYPIPSLEELMSEFNGSPVFSKLDLSQGYLQIPLDKSSRRITVLITHDGVYQF